MITPDEEDSAYALLERIRRRAPEYFDLLTARTAEEFDAAFDALLERSVMQMEANKENYETLDEVGLTGVLAAGLSIPGLTVTQETHSNGHVDLTVTADHCVPSRKKLGEAKLWNGPAYHIKGISQVLGRYTTGREGRGLLVEYVRKPGIKGLFGGLRTRMDKERPCEQTAPTSDHVLTWSFVSTHAHSCGEALGVCHVGCNLYTNPADHAEG